MNLLNQIIDHIFGPKYYANIINWRGSDRTEITSAIHTTREAAEAHRKEIEATTSFTWIATVSFRTKAL